MEDSQHIKILTKFTKLIHQKQKLYNIFQDNDSILVGISGGKDSLLLLEVLGELKTKWRYNFNVIPVHIKVSAVDYSVDKDAINLICQKYGYELKIFETVVNFDESTKKGPCFICSWHRRKLLFTLAREMNCNKLALGHHMDDAVQTLFMNMIYHGSISSMPLKLSMFNNTLEIIRPLLFINEKDIVAYQKLRNYPELTKDCPYGSNTKRNSMKELISYFEKIHPSAKQNIFKSMSKIYPFYLPEGEASIINGLNVIHPKED